MAKNNKDWRVEEEFYKLVGDKDQYNYQAYSGTDIQAAIYLPLITRKSIESTDEVLKFKVFGNLQTISVSSARSVSPVRVLGKSNPVAYSRGSRTIAGTMVFAMINKDVFLDVYDPSMSDSEQTISSSVISDQMVPFSVIITAANESGGVGVQVLNGVTLINFGNTYSINDVYTEVVYNYVALDITPFQAANSIVKELSKFNSSVTSYSSVANYVAETMRKTYGSMNDRAAAYAANRKADIYYPSQGLSSYMKNRPV